MQTATIVLEYIKVLLSAPVLAFIVAITMLALFYRNIRSILSRTAKITLPGGAEFSTSQIERGAEDIGSKNIDPENIHLEAIPGNLTEEQKLQIEPVIRGHIAAARLWEYRYLNFFFARGTQEVLDWLIGCGGATSGPFD